MKNNTMHGFAVVRNQAARTCEINMYGEVVSERPYDYWTGKPVEGQMIVLSEFLAELDSLKEYDEITVHLNSVGGDFFAGQAIYNRLKELNAKIITVNDSLAASAGSVILQAGDVRRVRRASSTMVHCASCLLIGYYSAADLGNISTQLNTVNENAATVYEQAGVESREKALEYMEAETWLTGEQAVEAGFADEVVEDGEALGVSMALDRSYMTARGQKICAAWMPDELPEGIDLIDSANDEPTPEVPPVEDNKNNEEGNAMDITTIDELRTAFPELCAQLAETTAAEATAAERERIKAIDELAEKVGDGSLISDAKYGEQPMNAEQFAVEAIRRNAVNSAVLNAIDSDAKDAKTGEVTAAYDSKMPSEPNQREPKSGVEPGVIDALNKKHS